MFSFFNTIKDKSYPASERLPDLKAEPGAKKPFFTKKLDRFAKKYLNGQAFLKNV